MARQTRTAIVLALGAALALGACGRKGPLEQPGAPPGKATDAPAGTPTPEAKPAEAAGAPVLKRPAPTPTAKPDAATKP